MEKELKNMIKKITTYTYGENYEAPCPCKSIINTNFILYAQCYKNYVEVTMNDGSKFLIKMELDDFFNWITE